MFYELAGGGKCQGSESKKEREREGNIELHEPIYDPCSGNGMRSFPSRPHFLHVFRSIDRACECTCAVTRAERCTKINGTRKRSDKHFPDSILEGGSKVVLSTGHTGTHIVTKVKQRLARLELGGVTRESTLHWVL
jgi:hypothetical protein